MMHLARFKVLLPIIFIVACTSESQVPNIPAKQVNIEINLSNLQYQALRQVGGYTYVEGGNKGIIIYRQSQSEYRAWDRICTYQPKDECARVQMHESGFYMEDPCCKTTFDLGGFPSSGPAKYPLVEYRTSTDGAFLYISN